MDVEHELFVDGVTESLTTDLSRIYGASVISRNTAFTYKGKQVDAKQIGRELNVRYVLEGSVQRGGSECGSMSSSSTRHREPPVGRPVRQAVADPFDMQDEIVSQLANELRPELLAAEARRADSVADPDSMDLYFQGVQQFNKGGVGNIEAARGYFERAVALDPTNIDALVGAARADVLVGAIYTTEHRAERLAEAEALLIKGISIAPRNHWAHLWLGFIQIQTNRASRAIGELEQALSLNRNLGAAHAWIGQAKITMGRAEEAEAHVNEAFRLSPSDAVAFIWTHIRGLARLHLGADAEAVALFRRSVDASRNYPLNHFYMAAALANSAVSMRRKPRSKPGWSSRQITRSPDF